MERDSGQLLTGRIVASGPLIPWGLGPAGHRTPSYTWALWQPNQPFRSGQQLRAAFPGASFEVSVVASDASEPAERSVATDVKRLSRAVGEPTCCTNFEGPGSCYPPTSCFTPRLLDSAWLGLSSVNRTDMPDQRPASSRQWVYGLAYGTSATQLSEEPAAFLGDIDTGHDFGASPTLCFSLRATHATGGQTRTFAPSCMPNPLAGLGEREATSAERTAFVSNCAVEPLGFNDDWCAVHVKSCRESMNAWRPTPPNGAPLCSKLLVCGYDPGADAVADASAATYQDAGSAQDGGSLPDGGAAPLSTRDAQADGAPVAPVAPQPDVTATDTGSSPAAAVPDEEESTSGCSVGGRDAATPPWLWALVLTRLARARARSRSER